MGAVVGYAGVVDPDFLRGATSLLSHRCAAFVEERSSTAALASSALAKSESGAVTCAMDGYLLNGKELARDLERRGGRSVATDAAIVAELFAMRGADAMKMLDGAFALALHTKEGITLARDALGEKPLYYCDKIPGALLFASESKAFLAARGFACEPDPEALLRLLVFSFVPGRETAMRGVYQLEPGCILHKRHGAARHELSAHWDLAERVSEAPEQEHVERTRALVERAVRRRIPEGRRVSSFLSGGVDSSSVVAELARAGAPQTAWSIAFGHGQPNEIAFARMVAEHTGVEHRILDVVPKDFIDLLPKILFCLDDPLCDCITVPNYLLAREAAREADVVFNGEGGDPLFGGPKNKFLILDEWYAFLGGSSREDAYMSSYHKFYEHLEELFTGDALARAGGRAALRELVRPHLQGDGARSFLNRLMRVNVKLKGGQNILVKVDKMLSANGVEARSPLFDKALAELAFEIPPSLKRRGDVEKYVFKLAVEPYLPRPVVYRKKAGMGVPLNTWFKKTELRDLAFDVLTSQRAKARGMFRQPFVERLLYGEPPASSFGQERTGELLWMLLAVEIWHRVFVDGELPS